MSIDAVPELIRAAGELAGQQLVVSRVPRAAGVEQQHTEGLPPGGGPVPALGGRAGPGPRHHHSGRRG